MENKKQHDFGSPGKYVGSAIAAAVVWILVFWRGGGFAPESGMHLLRCVCDGLFVSGVLVAAAGLLTLLNSGGAFDIVAFSTAKITKRAGKKTFYEYCEDKKNRRVIRWFLVITGAVFLIAAIIVTAVYMKKYGG